MKKRIRLIYTSRSLLMNHDENSYYHDEINQILLTSREHNYENNITGVLFYIDGYFFQCLEGKEDDVLSLMNRISQDPRHTDVKISYCKSIRSRMFKVWTMKFVYINSKIIDLLENLGYQTFDPVNFDEYEINLLMDKFYKMDDQTENNTLLNKFYYAKQSFWQRLMHARLMFA